MTTNHETIAEYLDRGGDIAEHPAAAKLLEILYYDIPIEGIDKVRTDTRLHLSDYIENGESALAPRDPAAVAAGRFTETTGEALARIIRSYTWELEVLESPALAERVRAALEASELSDDVAAEIRNLQSHVDAERRPFDVTLEERGSYRCAFTGAECEGMAVVVAGRGWYADETVSVADRMVFSPEALMTFLADKLRTV
jgi:hypothetical protein